MDEQVKEQLENMMGIARYDFNQQDSTTRDEVSAIQAYASCQIALQLDRIAESLESIKNAAWADK